MFTRRIHEVFKILDSDVGRPFSHITHHLVQVDLMKDVHRVQDMNQSVKREVRSETGQWYLLRILPYYISPQVTSGIVITLTDITELKKAQEEIQLQIEALRASEEKHRELFECMAQGVVYQDALGNIQSVNAAAERILGLSLDQMKGRTSLHPDWKTIREDGSDFPGLEHPAMVALRTGKTVSNVIMGVFHPQKGEHRWLNVNAVPKFRKGESVPYEVFATFDDITNLKQSQHQFQLLFQTMHHGFAYHRIVTDEAGKAVDYVFIEVNAAFERMTGLKRQAVLNRRVTEVLPGIREGAFDWIQAYGEVALTGNPVRFSQYSADLKQWFTVSAYSPQKDYFVTLFEAVTETRAGTSAAD